MNATKRPISRVSLITLLLAVSALSCTRPGSESMPTLRLATTTSIENSGLLGAILPDFKERYGVDVDVIAASSRQALTLGEQGDVDVVLVNARQQADRFVEQGFGINRQDVMFNDFVIVGPDPDPAGVRAAGTAAEALARIAEARMTFASRGDESDTHRKELQIWDAAGTAPVPVTGWYQSLGQGMGETLIVANEQAAYTMTDRATYVSMQDRVPDLVILFGGERIDQNPDTLLRNPYSVIQVNPQTHPNVNADLAATFIQWITSPGVQARIGEFGLEQYGQPLFLPVTTP